MDSAINPARVTTCFTNGEPAGPRAERGQRVERTRAGGRLCRHCGAPSGADEFCCAGCACVHRLVHEQGLEGFYSLKDAVTPPADPSLLQPRDHGWLEQAQAAAEAAAGTGTPELILDVQGVSCAGCVWLIERLFSRVPGAGRIEVNAQTGRLRLTWERGVFDAAAFARTLQSFNYLLGPAGRERTERPESAQLVRRIGLCTAFAMNVMLFTLPVYFGMEADFAYAPLFATLSMGFGTLSLLAGGGYFLNRAVRALRIRALHLDLPIGLGITGAYAGSLYGWIAGREEFMYFDFVSGFIVLMLVGRWAQVVAVERNQRQLLGQQPVPPGVHVANPDGTLGEVPAEQLREGSVFLAAAGRTVPVEAKLLVPQATFSLAWINGEAEPRGFRGGQRVPAGAVNLDRTPVRLEAVQDWDHSLLAELLRPSARADYRHRFIERVIQAYLVAILGVAGLAGAGWWLATGDLLQVGAVVTSILVVSCPCALGLAIPLTDEMATVVLRRRGVFVRAGDLWPRLAKVRKLVFDKTGTLTLETPTLLNPGAIDDLDASVKSALLALVQDNPHPVSRTLHEALLMCSRRPEPMAGDLIETIGSGVAIGDWTLGRPGWRAGGSSPFHSAAATHDDIDPSALHGPESEHPSGQARQLLVDEAARGPGDVELAKAGLVVGRFHFADTARPDARAELAVLGRRGLDVHILSGDRPEKVAAMMCDLGLPAGRGLGGLSPRDKAAWIETQASGDALMLGDGANDSLAFDRAFCRGTPVIHRGVLAQKADFYYLGRGIDGIRALFEVNDARRRTGAALLVFMVAYNLTAVGLAVAGYMNPLLAAVLMPLSSLATLAIVGMGMRHQHPTSNIQHPTPNIQHPTTSHQIQTTNR